MNSRNHHCPIKREKLECATLNSSIKKDSPLKNAAVVPRSILSGGVKTEFLVPELISQISMNSAHQEMELLMDKISMNVLSLVKIISVQVGDVSIRQKDSLVLVTEPVTIGQMENVPTSTNVHYQQFIAMVASAKILKAVISVLVLRYLLTSH